MLQVTMSITDRDVVKSGAPDEGTPGCSFHQGVMDIHAELLPPDHMVIFQDDLKVEPFIRKHDNLGR